MSKDAIVRVRIDSKIKQQSAEVLETMGLSMSDAVRLLLVRVAMEKQLPFNVQVPNPTTIAAMKELDEGGGQRFANAKELFRDLEI